MKAKITYRQAGETKTTIGELKNSRLFVRGRMVAIQKVISYEVITELKDQRQIMKHCIAALFFPSEYFYVSKSRKREEVILKHAGMAVLLNNTNVRPVDVAAMFNRSRESCYHAIKRVEADKFLLRKYGIESELLQKYNKLEKMFLSLSI